MSTIKDIAKLAGVSRGTVDRVLNGRSGVNPSTADRVLQIAERLQYSPNRLGKRLAIRKKQLQFGCVLFGSKEKNPYFQELASAIEQRAVDLREYGITVEIRYATLGDPASLIGQIDQLVSQGINGLVLTPTSHETVRDKIAQLKDKGIPTVTIDSDLSPSARLAYVGSDSFRSGQTAGNLMTLFTDGQVKAGILLGSQSVRNHTERVEGFQNYFKENGVTAEILAVMENHDDDRESYALTGQMLLSHPEMNALFLAAAGVEGACRAVMKVMDTRRIQLVSFDTAPFIREMLKKGVITATLGQQPEVQGKKALDILLDYLGLDLMPAEERFYTKSEIIIKSNLPK